MGVRSLAKRCLAVVAAVVVAYTPCANATPIMVVFDTTQLTGQSFILDLQLTGSATDSVAVTQFSPTPDGSITIAGDVAGTLETNDLVLTGGAATIPSVYQDPITLGPTLSFAFEATTAGGNVLPALFAFQLLDPQTLAPPVDADNVPLFGDIESGVLLTYQFGTSDAPVLDVFSTSLLPLAAPEPGAGALVLAALLALVLARPPRRRCPPPATAFVTR